MRGGILLLVFCAVAVLGTTTTTWVAELAPGAQAEEVARAAGVRVVRALTELGPDVYEFAGDRRRYRAPPPSSSSPEEEEEENGGGGDVRWIEEQVPRRRFKKGGGARMVADDDPLYQLQWHLHPGGNASVDISATDAPGGAGVLIAVVDDGLQHAHPELAHAYRPEHSWNFNGGGGDESDPAPRSHDEGHGTSAAGVAVAAVHNGHCGRGAAPLASVCGVRLIAAPVSDMSEAQALSFHARDVHIYTNSWGPADTGEGLDRPGRLVRLVLARNTAGGAGRGGLGSIYMWASGNGRDYNDSCAYDGYASNPYVNAIGALDHTGAQSWYSEGCAALMAVAPSSGAMRGIVTADLMGAAGYDPGECTTTFGGTSSATPLAAGIVALLLERHPQLSWRDVRHVIARGATRVNPHDSSWTTNGAGIAHSNRYGFGLLRVPALLAAADAYVLGTQETFGFLRKAEQAQFQTPRIVPQMGDIVGDGNFTITVHGNTIVGALETVVLTVRITHAEHGRILLELYSPAGTRSALTAYRAHVDTQYPSDGWSYTSNAFWGESVASDGAHWTLRARDLSGMHPPQGKLAWMQLALLGDAV